MSAGGGLTLATTKTHQSTVNAKAAALHLCRNGPARRGVCSYPAGAHGSWCPLDALAGSALTPQLQPHKRTQKKAKQPW